MKEFLRKLSLLIVLSALSFTGLIAQDEEDSEVYEPEGTHKSLFFDIGVGGPAGVSAAGGFRYSFVGISLGIAGFAKTIPAYSMYNDPSIKISPSLPLPSGYVEDRYKALLVTGDASFYLDYFKPVTLFGSIGFYTSQDSVLAKKDDNTNYRYFWKTENQSGACFGFGALYPISESLEIGAGYHTQRGVFGRISYYWY